MSNSPVTLPAVGSTVMEPVTTIVDGKLVKAEEPFVVVISEPGMIVGKLNGKGKAVVLFAASAATR